MMLLSRAGVLKVEGDSILSKAPLLRSYARSAHLLSLLEVFFPSAVQVTATDFNDATMVRCVLLEGTGGRDRINDARRNWQYISR